MARGLRSLLSGSKMGSTFSGPPLDRSALARTWIAPFTLLLLISCFTIYPGCSKDNSKQEGSDVASVANRAKRGKKKPSEAEKLPYPITPTVFDVAPLTAQASITPEIPLHTRDGRETTLRNLLSFRSLVFYLDSDYEERESKAASRSFTPLVKGGRELGFRLLLIFPKGTTASEIEEWYNKRQVDAGVHAAIDHTGKFAETSGWKVRTAALMDGSGTVGIVFPPSDTWDGRIAFEGMTDDVLMQAFKVPKPPPTLDAAARAKALELSFVALSTTPVKTELPKSLTKLATESGLDGRSEWPVYVTLRRPKERRELRGTAVLGTLGESIVRATWDALGKAGADSANWSRQDGEMRVTLDIAGPAYLVPIRDERSLWYFIEPGVHGLILRKGDRAATLLPSDVITTGLLTPRIIGRTKSLELMVEKLEKQLEVPAGSWKKADETELLRFETLSFGSIDNSRQAIDLYRANVLATSDPGAPEILESIALGGRWLLDRVQKDGKFAYEYIPHEDRWTTDYNIVRHAGSVYGLLEMWHFSQNEPTLKADADAYLDAASRAIGYVFDGIKVPETATLKDRRCLLDDKGRCESGAAALTLLTLLSRPSRDQLPEKYRSNFYPSNDTEVVTGLALTLIDMIDSDGKVWRKYAESQNEKKVKKEPEYYPGEAMLALMKLYEKTQDKRWLEGAKKIAGWQLKAYERDRFRFPDHWVMQALRNLWQATRDDNYAKVAYAMATHSSSEQYGFLWCPYPDYRGAWRRTDDIPRTTRAASRGEALRAVVELAWQRGDDARVWEDSLIFSARHLIEQQFQRENVWWLPSPDPAMGCYPMGILDRSCRIDNNQHAIVGLIGALNVVKRREGIVK